jgi:peptide/nickel transport system substrate-binding protein
VCPVRHAFKKDRTVFVCLLLAVALSVVGCAQTPVDAKRDPVTLRFGVASPKTSLTASGVRGFVSNLLSESLIGIAWDGRPVERVASGWTVSPDGLTVDLRLRDKLQFHNGTPVDSEYIKADLQRHFEQPFVGFESVIAVEALEKNIVRITLSRPEALLLLELANLSVSAKDADVGLGPFKLLTRTPTTRLAAYEGYYRGRPSVDFVEVSEYEEQRTAWAAFMRRDIDAVHELSPEAIDFFKTESQATSRQFEFTGPYYIQLMFNVRNPILKKPAVRQALSYAIDRQSVIDNGLNGQGVVADGPVWPFHWAYSTAHKTYTYNPEAATIQLDSAGFPVKPAAKRAEMPRRFKLRCITVSKEARFEKIALVLQKQLYAVGVDLQIEALPADELVKRLSSGDFDTVLIQRASGRSLGWTYRTFHSLKMPIGYSAADEILDRLRGTTTDTQVRSAVSDLQQVFHEEPPAIFIAWPKVTRVVSTKFVVPEERGRDVLSSLWQWRVAEAPK